MSTARLLSIAACVAVVSVACATDASRDGGASPTAPVGAQGKRLTSSGTPLRVTEGDVSVEMGAASGCDGFVAEGGKATIVACAAQIDEPRPFAAVLHAIDESASGESQLILYKLERSGDADLAVGVAASKTVNVGPPTASGRDYFEIRMREAKVGRVPIIIVEYYPPRAHAPDTEYDVITWEAVDAAPTVAAHIDDTVQGPSLEVAEDELIVMQPELSGADGGRTKVRSIRRVGPGDWREKVSFKPAPPEEDAGP